MAKVTLVGNAHIDPVWLWQWREGYHEVKATFRSALDRMKEFPDYVFTSACACYYQWVEESDPEMFEEIRVRVLEGRWRIIGGMWIQPDMNAPSGESIARQLLYSQRYFMEKFGRIATIGYNVDTFGHNAMLPQLFRGAGMDAYVWMRPMMPENAEIPQGPMLWESPDGSRVKTYRIHGAYCMGGDLSKTVEDMKAFSDSIGQPVMLFYGVGNHGGGPTIQLLNQIEAFRNEDAVYGSPYEYFAALDEAALPVWKGELQHHASGCYSTHAASKRMHRRAENALTRMETFGALAGVKQNAMQGWKNLMFNEFHDIMGGCSIPEAMEDVVIQLSEAVAIADREENRALQKLSWRIDTSKGLPPVRSKEGDWKLWGIPGIGTPIVVFNPHAFDAAQTVQLRRNIKSVTDEAGNRVPAQIVRASRTNGEDKYDAIFRAEVPAFGWRVYWVFFEETEPVKTELSASATCLENKFIRAEFDPETGALIHLTDKRSGKDALSGPVSARMFDISESDTWAHMIFKFDKEAERFGNAKLECVENGPVRASVRAVSRCGESEMEVIYRLCADSDQLECDVRVDMRHKQRMLKWCFPTAGKREISEIPFAAIERRGNGDEEHMQNWVALGNLAAINDGKYSYSAADGELRLTLAHTSIFADHYGQQQRDESCRYMDMGEQRFRIALVPFGGDWREKHLTQRGQLFNRALPHIEETYHTGDLPPIKRGIKNPEGVCVSAFKRAEADDAYILRVFEPTGRGQKVSVKLSTPDRTIEDTLKPYEFKTYRLPDNPAESVSAVPLTEL